MATEIIGLSTEERQVIASAVRYNTTRICVLRKLSRRIGNGSGNRLSAGCKADGHPPSCQRAWTEAIYQKIDGNASSVKDREAVICIIDSNRDISLELGLLKDKVEFFEEVFGIHPILRKKKSVKERKI